MPPYSSFRASRLLRVPNYLDDSDSVLSKKNTFKNFNNFKDL